ncbi:hypothetical protein C7974DRAFT_38158 [Boeremia exigua]|uniref:uncharacterized protein n=1 Tax=Boeremia exigua TaxID=749465 RepID=UPI001E8E7B6A|nr:uncharacterized protein C7974DRAFT_38158 [Boeremia exigua]KAH6618848.1 hypothetical protein C7974DRAFT_38158 [Boeremia exigua]
MLDNASPAGIRVNTIVLAFTLVAGTIVFLRLFTRLVLTKGAGLEDVFIAFAMALSIGLAVLTSEEVMHGLGEHVYDLSENDVIIALKMFWASLWVYNLALTMTKISILVQYIRIFPPRHFRCACYAMLCIVVACGAWGVFGNVFLCHPINFFWDKAVKGGYCMNDYIIWFTTAGLNIGQDVIILFMPIRVIRSLQISKSQKKGLITMLALGVSVIVVSTVRLYTLDNLANSEDQTFDNPDQATLSGVEVNVGIICACLPAMRPLFAVMMPKYFSSATAYTATLPNDIERPKEIRNDSVSTRVGTPSKSTIIPSTHAASSQASLDLRPHPSASSQRTQSRNPSTAHSRSASTASRAPSTLSISTTSRTAGPFHGSALNPLRMSPVTPFAPPASLRLSHLAEDDIALLGPGAYTRRPSDASISLSLPRSYGSRRRSRSQASTKPLPLTPFPVAGHQWTQLTAIPRPSTPLAPLLKPAEAAASKGRATSDDA